MIINDLTTKYTLANNWILRTDPYYESRKYSVYDITSRLTLYVTRSCYTLLKIFHDKALSFSSLYEAIEQKNIKIDWEGFWNLCKEVEPLNFLVPSEFPLHKGDGFPNGDGVCGYDVPITSTPLTAELHFTHNCNLRCKHCFQGSSPNSSRYKELGVSDWIGIFEQFEDCRMHNVTLTGGEIMFYPHFSEVFNNIVDKRINYRVLTNGTLINSSNVEALSRKNVSLTISLDGHSDKQHDQLRGKGVFNKVVKNIELLVAHGAKVSLTYTINSNNYLYLQEAVKLAISLGVKGIFFGFTDRIGRANENLTLILSRSQREIVKHNFAQLEEEYGHLLSLSLVEVATLERYHEFVNNKVYCSAGTTHIGVSSDGKLYPCIYAFGHEELLIGDLMKENLKELWENRDKWRMFRGGFSLENIDTCSTCTLNKKCSLMACRLRNYDQGNSFYNKPIECAVDYSIAL